MLRLRLIGAIVCVLCGFAAVSAEAANYKYHYFEGNYTDVPDFSAQVPVKTGTWDTTPSLSDREVAQNYGFHIRTTLTLNINDYYAFFIGIKGKARITFAQSQSITVEGSNSGQMIQLTNYTNFGISTVPVTIDYIDIEGGGDLVLKYATYYGGESNAPLENVANYEEFPGVRYQYYEYESSGSLPDLDTLAPVSEGELATVEIPQGAAAANFAVRFKGFIDITEPDPGNYQIIRYLSGTLNNERWGNYNFGQIAYGNAAVGITSNLSFTAYGALSFQLDFHGTHSNPSVRYEIILPSGERKTLAEVLVQESDDGGGEQMDSVTDLSALIGAGQVALSWVPVSSSSTTVTSYQISRGVLNGQTIDYAPLQTIDKSLATFVDSGIGTGVTYGYKVESLNAAGEAAPGAPEIRIAVPASYPAIGAFNGSAAQDGVTLTWTATGVQDTSQFEISRSVAGGEFSAVATVNGSLREYHDANAPPGNSVTYKIQNRQPFTDSINSRNYTVVSNSPTVTVDTPSGLEPVTNMGAEIRQGQVRLTWDPVPPTNTVVHHYYIFRGIYTGGSTQLSYVATVAKDGASYTDTGVSAGTTYIYMIQSRSEDDRYDDSSPSFRAPVPATFPSITSFTAAADRTGVTLAWAAENIGSGAQFSLTRTVAGGALENLAVLASASTEYLDDSAPENKTIGYTISSSERFTDPHSGGYYSVISNQSDASAVTEGIPPKIVFDVESPLTTTQEVLEITGNISDPIGIKSVTASSNRFSGQTFSITLQGNGDFTTQVPIEFDENFIKISASDTADNTDYKVLEVNRPNINRPVVTVTSHINGQIVNADQLELQGYVSSALALQEIILEVNGQMLALQQEAEGRYGFTLHDTLLLPGANEFLFKARAGDESAELAFRIHYDEDAALSAPRLVSVTPTAGSELKNDSFMLAGELVADYPITAITVNGEPITILEQSTSNNFGVLISFDGASSVDVVLTATSINGQSMTETLTYYHDDVAPVIHTYLTDSPDPQNLHYTRVFENPYELSGTVTDTNLSSVTVNDVPVDIFPGDEDNQYIFQAIINLESDRPDNLVPVEVKAFDQAGNLSTKQYYLENFRDTKIEIIAPRVNSEFVIDDTHYDLQILARATSIPDDPYVFARVRKTADLAADEIVQPVVYVNFSEVTYLTLHDNGVITGEIEIPAETTEYVVQLFIANGYLSLDQVSFASREFKIENRFTVPLALLRTEPVNMATGIEPNQPVILYFNKAFNPEKTTLLVTETAHGKTYVNNDPRGASFLQARGSQLQDVHRQQSVVPGGLSRLPGDNIFAFYPERDFSYDGLVQVQVKYRGTDVNGEDEGEKISQFQFKTRPLPTMVEGIVVDQFSQAVQNVKVAIAELGRETLTDSEGAFSFGYGDNAGRAIKGGLYTIEVNGNLANARFGEISKQVNVANGELNSAGIIKLPVLNKTLPFYSLESGNASAVLANGELTLNLAGTKLRFPDGGDKGGVHVNMLRAEDLTLPALGGLQPNWAFGLQPQGIVATGPVGVTLKAPSLNGSYDYLPDDGQLVLLVGKDPDQEQLIPMGVGKIDNQVVVSVAPIEIPVLDYLAYVLVPESAQATLQAYADGEINRMVLVSRLQQEPAE